VGREVKVYDVFNPERAQKLQREQVEADSRQFMRDLKEVIGTPEGRRVMFALIAKAAPMDPAFTGSSETYYLLGRQDYGKWIYDAVTAADYKKWRLAEDEFRASEQKKERKRNHG